jgi:hypothetical protein
LLLSLARTLFQPTNQALVNTAIPFEPPAWSCGVRGVRANGSRSLFEDGRDDDHNHLNHDHSDHDHSDHDHTHHVDPSNTEDALANLRRSLRGSNLHFGKRRRVQGKSYNYWVDVYVEIDYAFCTRNKETCAVFIGPNTINYGVYRLFSHVLV